MPMHKKPCNPEMKETIKEKAKKKAAPSTLSIAPILL